MHGQQYIKIFAVVYQYMMDRSGRAAHPSIGT